MRIYILLATICSQEPRMEFLQESICSLKGSNFFFCESPVSKTWKNIEETIPPSPVHSMFKCMPWLDQIV